MEPRALWFPILSWPRRNSRDRTAKIESRALRYVVRVIFYLLTCKHTVTVNHQACQWRDALSQQTHPATKMYHHIAYGLRVHSGLELQGLPTAEGASDEADAEIVLGEMISDPDDAVGNSGFYQTMAHEFVLRIHGTAEYVVKEGREIVVRPHPAAEPERVRLFLMGSAMGALLYQRGILLLHGSAIDTPAGVMVFVGAQGEGKSTLAAALHREGHALLCDDVCAVLQASSGSMVVHPGAPLMRLCEDALDHFDGYTEYARSANFDVDKYVVSLQQPHLSAPRKLAGVHVLCSHDANDIALRPVRGFDRMKHVIGNLYRPEYLGGMASAGEVMRLAGQLAKQVPVIELWRPRDLSRIPEVVEVLKLHWNNLLEAERGTA